MKQKEATADLALQEKINPKYNKNTAICDIA